MDDGEPWVRAEGESPHAQHGHVGDPHPGDHVRVRQVLCPGKVFWVFFATFVPNPTPDMTFKFEKATCRANRPSPQVEH